MTEQTKFWEAGLPTKTEVDLLMKTWPDPKVGDVFSYEEVSKVIGVPWNTPRFKSVTTPWRKRLLEKGIVLECNPGVAFFAADPDQLNSMSHGILVGFSRKARKHRNKLSVVPTRTDEQRMACIHNARIMMAIESQARTLRLTPPDTSYKPGPVFIPQEMTS